MKLRPCAVALTTGSSLSNLRNFTIVFIFELGLKTLKLKG